ncbi:xanthine dehydrogenase family protein molybdopterin-binding subunit [Mycolicibacterium mucogenicum]|uniref:Xanthine dehydrogenase family protein molybdopterin-binding subunit n=1 Tax=Mycolicibacterium mucogenicum DSM 44124 TaxID=1226753 RepID=A0A8H2JEL1_MYCMU|nr:xanthine dehydrogenase family protein molybdopterin-binding subunit [Mycolicibacterium mucogenicum]KAB7756299.1 aldehyde oxidase [Mycolicibacterium mucogenicum DSM 44124]QPG68082.1 xanthine dehydrogenase family protein molybdopterin-binding subunit [Mycolicibacterium mucogenicum DSM 44124]
MTDNSELWSEAIGRPVNRVEGSDKVTGRARYAADTNLPDVQHAVMVQSTVSHGRVTRDSLIAATDRARSAPGVTGVLSPLNCPALHTLPADLTWDLPLERRPPLSDLTVQHRGQHLALVVADTLENAQYAASLMDLTYDELPALLTARDVLDGPSHEDSGPIVRSGVYQPDHFVKLEEEKLQDHRGPADEPIDGVKVTARYTTPENAHYPIELASTIARWDGDHLTVHDTTRWIAGERQTLATYLGIPVDNIRIIAPLVGGAFGSKSFMWMHVVLCAVAARMTGRAVKLVLPRAQMFTSTGHRPPTEQHLSLVADAQTRLTSIEHHTLTETSTIAHFCEPTGLSTRFLYQSPRMVVSHSVARVHRPTPCFMRGPGEAPGLFALEVAMDELAHALGVDPLQLRITNYAAADQASGRPWSEAHLLECYRQGADRFGWEHRPHQPRSLRRDGVLVGWGMATATYPGRRMPAGCRVHTRTDGTVEFSSATHEVGTGVRTVMTQIAADSTGLQLPQVVFYSGDSDFPTAPYSGASQTTAAVGSAVFAAGLEWKRRLLEYLVADRDSPCSGFELSALDIRAGYVVSAHADRPVSTVATLLAAADSGLLDHLTFTSSSGGAPEDGPMSQSFGAHFCEVEVDEELGRASVTRWVAAMDCGRVINPKLARSQVVGGITFGLGMALLEDMPYDPGTGHALGEYYVPTHADVPSFDITFVDGADTHLTEFGARGVGEIGICGVPAAVANAVFHATGRRLRDLPITIENLLSPFSETHQDRSS